MAQRFSKPFYNSKEWKIVRAYILRRDQYLCTQCGEPAEEVHHVIWLTPGNIGDSQITLNEDNLTSLCKDCHFKVHKEAKVQSVVKNNKKNNDDIVDGFEFDENGFIVQSPHK